MSKKRKKPTSARSRSRPGPRPSDPSSQVSQVSQEAGLALLRTAAGSTPGGRPQDRATGSAARPAPPGAPARAVAPAQSADAPARLEVGRVEVTRFSCGVVDGAEPQALGLTCWFDVPADAPATPITVAFTGRRAGVTGRPGPGDSFAVQTTVDEVVPGAGRTAVTTRVRGIAAGEWDVSAAPVLPGGRSGPSVTTRGTTAFDPVIRVSGPGVRLGAWPGMVLLGTVLALITQASLSSARDLPTLRVFLLTVLAAFIGTAGAKVYYLATHRGESTGLLTVGMSVQGFVLAAIGTLALSAFASGLPVGQVLDVTTPGLLFGMTVGRFGCFFGGCCAGRVSASRWALWSSDRRLGARRIPVQLMESAAAAVVGVVALLLVVRGEPPGGTVFVGSIAAYTFARQVLFPLRTVPRDTTHGRRITMAVAALVLVADVAVAATA